MHYQEVWWYLLGRDWVGLKWHPVLKVWKQVEDKHSEAMQNSYRWKPLAIIMLNIAPESHDCSSQSRNQMLRFWLCSSFFFFLFSVSSSITHKVYSVYQESVHQTNALLSKIFHFLVTAVCEFGELWSKTHVTMAFVYAILCVITHTTP